MPALSTQQNETPLPIFSSIRRLSELDGIRGLAVLFILIWHYIGIPLPPAGVRMQPDSWLPSFKLSLILFRSGVDLFFVLSGFLITGILLENRNTPSYFRTFFFRRSCRILPLYLTLLVIFGSARIAGAHGLLFDGPIPFLAYLTMTQNYFMASTGTYGAAWLGATWSLAVEEQFYFIFPFLIRHFDRVLPWIFGASIIGAPLLRIWAYHHFGNDDFAAYVWLPCRLDALCWGALLVWFLRQPAWNARLCSHKRIIKASFLLLCLGAIVLDAALARDIGYHMSLWGHSLLAALYAGAILLSVQLAGQPCVRFLRNPALTGLGRISYGVYLLHGIILIAVFAVADRPTELNGPPNAALIGLALALSISLATLSYRRFELPFINAGAQMRYR